MRFSQLTLMCLKFLALPDDFVPLFYRKQTNLGLHVKCLIYLTKYGISRQVFVKVPNIKFQENLSSGSHADTCGQTDGRPDANRRYSLFIRMRLKTTYEMYV